MSNLAPVGMDREQLAGTLEAMAKAIRVGDSYEGNIEYLMPDPEDPPGVEFKVRGLYRIGNSMGQGGIRMIGDVPS